MKEPREWAQKIVDGWARDLSKGTGEPLVDAIEDGIKEAVLEQRTRAVGWVVEGMKPYQPEHCTGFAAVWCLVHGDCICLEREFHRDDPLCPLHGRLSRHMEGPLP